MINADQLEEAARALLNPYECSAEDAQKHAAIVREAKSLVNIQVVIQTAIIDLVAGLRAVEHEMAGGLLRFPNADGTGPGEVVPDTGFNRLNRLLHLLHTRWGR